MALEQESVGVVLGVLEQAQAVAEEVALEDMPGEMLLELIAKVVHILHAWVRQKLK